ncbi:MAG TPA: diguanylate cyclase, partial [Anaerolineaceae bacterium]
PDLLALLENPKTEPGDIRGAASVPGYLAQVEFSTLAAPPAYLEASLNNWFQADRRLAGRLVILHDITRRWQAEQHLRDSERLYRLLVNASPVGIVLMDKTGQVTFASPKMFEMFKATDLTTVAGQMITSWIHPDEQDLSVQRVRQGIESGVPLPAQEYRLMRRDGSVFWGEVNSVPTLDDAGKSQGLLSIVHDISARKELELALKRNLSQQTFINDLLQILYRPRDLTEALGQVLERTGVYFGATRVYLCQDSNDGTETSIQLEWSQPPMRPRAHDSLLVRYTEIKSWRALLDEQGMIAYSRAEDAPPDIADFMAVWNAQSLAAFPIYGGEGHIFGFLGLDYCDQARSLEGETLDRLRNVCQLVSGAVSQREIEGAEHRQRLLAEALHDTSSALNSTLNFEEVLDRILSNLGTVVQHDAASIALVDEENNVRFVRWRGYDAAGEAALRAYRAPLAERETYRWMALTGEPMIIPDTWLDRQWYAEDAFTWIRSFAGAPIQIKGKVVGFINLDSHEPDVFVQDLFYSLHVFADQAAVAIENARLYDALNRRVEGMSILNRIGMTLTAGLEMDQVLISLFEQCRQVLPIDVFYVALFDAVTGRIDFPLFYREGPFENISPHNIHQTPSVTGEVIRQRRTIYIPDAALPDAERDFHVIHLGGHPARSYVGVPLILLDQVVGVISMQSLQPYAYSGEQISLLETIATQAAIAVQNARLYDQMKQMAITDSVTLLFTRRHFTTLGRSEVERALRYKRALSVMMVDIDHFKQVNDTYGHNSGDIVLQDVARVTRQALRATDLIGRWGGEEFVIVLPEADSDGAMLIAERIRRMVADTQILLPDAKIQVTISIGVATLKDTCCSLDALVDVADRAMYLAKQGGRNQVRGLDQ